MGRRSDEVRFEMSLPKSKLESQLLATPEQYLALEREAFERHEWLDGLIYAMAGESASHSLITTNIITELNLQLRGRPCAVYSPNMKTRAELTPAKGSKGLFAYPDTMVVCGKPVFHDQHQDVIINPKVIFEVLSKSTSRYDHEGKFEKYAQNKSLTDYLLVSQHRPHIQHYIRKPRGRWEVVIETKLKGSLVIASIKCKLKLANVYDRIEFPLLDAAQNPLE
jgi:Uma2 family endonuclease